MRQKADTNKRPCKTGPIYIILNAINIHKVYLLANMEKMWRARSPPSSCRALFLSFLISATSQSFGKNTGIQQSFRAKSVLCARPVLKLEAFQGFVSDSVCTASSSVGFGGAWIV